MSALDLARTALERGASIREAATQSGLSKSAIVRLRAELVGARAALGQPPLPSAKPGPRTADELVLALDPAHLAALETRAPGEGISREALATAILVSVL